MSDISEDWPKKGDLVRYGNNPTDLCIYGASHVGGWVGEHCTGGEIFFSDTISDKFYPLKPSMEDYKTWFDTEKYRT